MAGKAWWLSPLKEVSAGPQPTAEGLSQKEAHKRLKVHGRNVFLERPRPPPIVEFAKRLRNPLILVLLGASLVSALAGELNSATNAVFMGASTISATASATRRRCTRPMRACRSRAPSTWPRKQRT